MNFDSGSPQLRGFFQPLLDAHPANSVLPIPLPDTSAPPWSPLRLSFAPTAMRGLRRRN